MINFLKFLVRIIDQLTEQLGRTIAWLTFAMVLLTCIVVFMRYFLGVGSIALQESVTYLHAIVFLLGAAYTFKQGGHVRVDIFYQKLSVRKQALIDLIGNLIFLTPLCVLILVFSWDYVANSWSVSEVSKEGRGLPFVYLLKTLLIAMPISLLLQSVAETVRNILFLLGLGGEHIEPSHEEML